jgi:carbamoyl-phosphate synthase large subunit
VPESFATRVLVTGAGGPAAVAVLRSLAHRDDVTLLAADMDRYASGLYLVDAGSRHLVEAGVS